MHAAELAGSKQRKDRFMKIFVWAVLGGAGLVGTMLYITWPKVVSVTPAETAVEATASPSSNSQPIVEVPSTPSPDSSSVPSTQSPSSKSQDWPVAASHTDADSSQVEHLVDLLTSPQSTHEQKQAAWKQLRDSGKLDQAIGQLELRMAANPRDGEYPAALGQAYLKKCAILQDTREKGILVLQADKLFETALTLDPSNWDARFTKAVALTYWPATMNKSDEVIQQFNTLLQQQQEQPPQAHFANTYLMLGNFYQKNGHPDSALAVWQQGAGQFPDNEELKNKLSVNAPQNAGTTAGQ
jgi:tetratricopeptide (TPR) repeat protein